MLRDGEVSCEYETDVAQHDVQYVFENGTATRVVHLADGYCLTLPYTDVTVDSSLGALKRYTAATATALR